MTTMVLHSFESLKETFEARASEWMLTGATVSLGALFFLNESMFYKEAFEGLRVMSDNQHAWAMLFTLIGLLRLTVLFINGAYFRTPLFRAIGAFLCSGIWFTLCIGFIRNGSVLTAIMPWIFLLDGYNVKRAGREAGQSEFIQRHAVKERADDGIASRPHS